MADKFTRSGNAFMTFCQPYLHGASLQASEIAAWSRRRKVFPGTRDTMTGSRNIMRGE